MREPFLIWSHRGLSGSRFVEIAARVNHSMDDLLGTHAHVVHLRAPRGWHRNHGRLSVVTGAKEQVS